MDTGTQVDSTKAVAAVESERVAAPGPAAPEMPVPGTAAYRELYAEHGPEILKALEALGAPQQQWQALFEVFGLCEEPELAAGLIQLARINSIPWDRVSEYLLTRIREILPPEALEELTDDPEEFAFLVKVDRTETQSSIYNVARTSRIKLFGCSFQRELYPLLRQIKEVKEGARIFSMRLSDEERERFLKKQPDANSTHCEAAFAYIRYFEDGDDVVITEIQSDGYSSLGDRSLKERYKHWEKLLLTAFESFIHSVNHRPRVIIIPDSYNLFKRWPRLDDDKEPIPIEDYDDIDFWTEGIGEQLAIRVYDEVPEELGYEPLEGIEYRFEKSSIQRGISIDSGRAKYISEREVPLTEGFGPAYYDAVVETWSSNRSLGQRMGILAASPDPNQTDPHFANDVFFTDFAKVIERVFKLAGDSTFGWPVVEQTDIAPAERRQSTFQYQGHDLLAEVDSSIERAAATPHALSKMFGMCPELLEQHRIDLAHPLYGAIAQALPRTLIPFSRGADQGVTAEWALPRAGESGLAIQFIQKEASGRHPEIRILSLGDGGVLRRTCSVGFKGAGLREKGEEPLQDTMPDWRLPVYRRVKQDGKPLLETHRYWGGLTGSHAASEFVSTLALRWLLREVSPHEEIPVPIPVDVLRVDELPVWRNGELLQHIPKTAYAQMLLGYLDVDLAVYRSLSPCDVRITHLLRRVFNDDGLNPDNNVVIQEQSILDALALVYRVHGKEFQAPQAQLQTNADGIATMREYLLFLKSIYEANAVAAEEVIATVEHRTLGVLGAVHGAGGHLGGSRASFAEDRPGEFDCSIGAVMGGAPSARNTDILGFMHDIDQDVYFPWVKTVDYPTRRKREEAFRQPTMMLSDLRYWEHGMYWLRNVLRGREIAVGEKLSEYPFGNPRYQLSLSGEDDSRDETERALLTISMKERSVSLFRESQHLSRYWNARVGGEKFARRRGYTTRYKKVRVED